MQDEQPTGEQSYETRTLRFPNAGELLYVPTQHMNTDNAQNATQVKAITTWVENHGSDNTEIVLEGITVGDPPNNDTRELFQTMQTILQGMELGAKGAQKAQLYAPLKEMFPDNTYTYDMTLGELVNRLYLQAEEQGTYNQLLKHLKGKLLYLSGSTNTPLNEIDLYQFIQDSKEAEQNLNPEESKKMEELFTSVFTDLRNQHLAYHLAEQLSKGKNIVTIYGGGHMEGILNLVEDILTTEDRA